MHQTQVLPRPYQVTNGSADDLDDDVHHSAAGRTEVHDPLAAVRGRAQEEATFPEVSYSIRKPLIAQEMTSCWICSVPSKMS